LWRTTKEFAISYNVRRDDPEGRALLEKAGSLRALAGQTSNKSVQKLFLLLADSYEKMAGNTFNESAAPFGQAS
jgi:hypothetical protein